MKIGGFPSLTFAVKGVGVGLPQAKPVKFHPGQRPYIRRAACKFRRLFVCDKIWYDRHRKIRWEAEILTSKDTAQQRTAGGVEYTLVRKSVKNMNLRVRKDGTVQVSANPRMPAARTDAFVAAHADWIRAKQSEVCRRMENAPELPTMEQARQRFEEISSRIYPLFAGVLGNRPPEIRVSRMSSRWGVCYPDQHRITLALGLAAVPQPLIYYVVLHEYCHFVQPNHQKPFWDLMERYMPDAKLRRKVLQTYPCRKQ